MIDWREHGEVAITFDLDDGEKVIELRRPKFGQLNHFVSAETRFAREELAAQQAIRDDESLTDDQKADQLGARRFAQTLRWWELVMCGDESCKGLASEKPPPSDDYPLDLLVRANVSRLTSHWLLPLVPGEKQPEPISTPPDPDLSPEPPSTEPPSSTETAPS